MNLLIQVKTEREEYDLHEPGYLGRFTDQAFGGYSVDRSDGLLVGPWSEEVTETFPDHTAMATREMELCAVHGYDRLSIMSMSGRAGWEMEYQVRPVLARGLSRMEHNEYRHWTPTNVKSFDDAPDSPDNIRCMGEDYERHVAYMNGEWHTETITVRVRDHDGCLLSEGTEHGFESDYLLDGLCDVIRPCLADAIEAAKGRAA